MQITKKGYVRRFVKLFIKKTGLNYDYAKINAEYFAEDENCFYSESILSDVMIALLTIRVRSLKWYIQINIWKIKY